MKKNRLLLLPLFVLLVSLLFTVGASATEVDAATFDELKAAIQDSSVTVINVTADINVPCQSSASSMTSTAALQINRTCTIQGKNGVTHTIKRTGDSGNNNRSVLEIWGTGTYDGIAVTLKNIVFDGGAVWASDSTPQSRFEAKTYNYGTRYGKSTQNSGVAGRSVIDVAYKATLNVESGVTVCNGDCSCNTLTHKELGSNGGTNTYGGAIRVECYKDTGGGTVNIKSGAVIEDCCGSGYGGGVGAYCLARLNVYGGTFRCCSANNGGGMCVTYAAGSSGYSDPQVHAGIIAISGGVFEDCYAKTGGAALAVYGDATAIGDDEYTKYSRITGLTAVNCTTKNGSTNGNGPAVLTDINGKLYLADAPAVVATGCTGNENYTLQGYDQTVDGIYDTGNGTAIYPITTATHTLTFMVDGTKLSEIVVEDGKTSGAMFPADPVKTGYSFLGWYEEETGESGTRITKDTVITKDMTLYAHLAEHTHNWTYALKASTTNTVVATCTGDGACGYTGTDTELTVTIADVDYDGSAQGATLSGTTIAGYTAETMPKIQYEGVAPTVYAKSATAPTDAGTYKASLTIGAASVAGQYTIAKSSVSVTEADISYKEQADGSFKAVVNGLTLDGIAEKDKPYTAYTATAVMLDKNGGETTDLSEAASVKVTLTLDETAAVNKNYTASADNTFTLDLSDKENVGLTVSVTPGDVTVKEGKTVTFTARVSYNHSAKKTEGLTNDALTFTYQWYVDRNDGSGPVAIEGATKSAYTTSAAKPENDGYKYTCVVKDNHGREETSEAATLHVEPAIPTTGDGNMPLLFAGLLLLAGAGLVVLKKKKAR